MAGVIHFALRSLFMNTNIGFISYVCYTFHTKILYCVNCKNDIYSDFGRYLCRNAPDCFSFILWITFNMAYVGRDGGGGDGGGVSGEGVGCILIFASLSGCNASTSSQQKSFLSVGYLGCVFRVTRI